jgi:hypothetical protein
MAQETGASYRSYGWWRRKVVKEADHDLLRMGERIGNIIAMFFIVFVALIFINIQLQGNGFFTDDFGLPEEILFYGSLLFGVIPSFVRAAAGRRNLGRFVDLFGSALFIVAATYLLIIFPFDFTSLLTFLSPGVQAAFSWFNNDLFPALPDRYLRDDDLDGVQCHPLCLGTQGAKV